MSSHHFDFATISKYRGSLMGIAIIGVMLGHFAGWVHLSGPLNLLLKPIVGLVFTEGFLFLSGFGLYYSFSKNGSLKDFYKKRINRLLIPFILMALPFYLSYLLFSDTYQLKTFMLDITTLRFWFEGNAGMWYISVSLLLYFLFPFVYRLNAKVGRGGVIVCVSIICYILAIMISLMFPKYFEGTYLGFTQMPLFFIGMYCGSLAFNNKKLKYDYLAFVVLVALTIALNILDTGIWGRFGNGFLRLTCIFIICILFQKMDGHLNWLHRPLEWFGRYSLEFYVLHMLIYGTLHSFFPSLSSWIAVLITITVCMIVCEPFHKITEKIKI